VAANQHDQGQSVKAIYLLYLQLLQLDVPFLHERLQLVRIINRRLLYTIYVSALHIDQRTICVLQLCLGFGKLLPFAAEPLSVHLADIIP
jgi:hypothetical protein